MGLCKAREGSVGDEGLEEHKQTKKESTHKGSKHGAGVVLRKKEKKFFVAAVLAGRSCCFLCPAVSI